MDIVSEVINDFREQSYDYPAESASDY
jgi:hypothetical protein